MPSARRSGVPAAALLGGAVRDSVPVLWTLASGDPAQEIEEAERKLAARLHDTFKVKIGAQAPEADLARLRRLAAALEGRAQLIVDANQAWDETTAIRCLPVLGRTRRAPGRAAAAGLERRRVWRGCARARHVPLMADECVFSTHDMLAVAQRGRRRRRLAQARQARRPADLRKVAAVAEAAGHRALRRLPAGKLDRAPRRICRFSRPCASSPGAASISARRS